MSPLNTMTNNGLTITHYLNAKCLQPILLLIACLAQCSHAAEESTAADQRFSTAIAAAYQELVSDTKAGDATTDVEEIVKLSASALAADNPAGAVATIARNMPAIKQQIHLPSVQTIVALALSQQATFIADRLLEQAQNQSDSLGEARINIEFAKYYATQENWPAVLTLLKSTAGIENLAKDDSAEAQLLMGTALQHQKKHREAMAYYEKIKPDSSIYRLAQLNLATANIRQDWWTDAQLCIQNALKINASKRDELDYRLYTLLGYSQIQYGFYRDARESFRNVPIKSQYVNRALLGLGMAALHQQDFIGALNAFNNLRTKQEYDISVAESYLLHAFTLRQLNQYDAALTSYEEAITYYTQLEKTITRYINEPGQQRSFETMLLRPEARKNKKLRALSIKINHLNGLLKQPLSSATLNNLTNLSKMLSLDYSQQTLALLTAEKKSVESYLSQSRFGLATLYDGK